MPSTIGTRTQQTLNTERADQGAETRSHAADVGMTKRFAGNLTFGGLKVLAAAVAAPGGAASHSYVPADTITVAGTAITAAVLTVATTKAVSATVAAAGTGGTPGTQTVTGTTGTGTKFQASVTVSEAGAITAVNSISVAGSYTANPTDITQEPVTGASLTGAQLNVLMGVGTVTVTTAGRYTAALANPAAQASSSGSGTGATFTLTFANDATYTGRISASAGELAAFAANDPVLVEGSNLNNGHFIVTGIDGAGAYLVVDPPPKNEGPVAAVIRTE